MKRNKLEMDELKTKREGLFFNDSLHGGIRALDIAHLAVWISVGLGIIYTVITLMIILIGMPPFMDNGTGETIMIVWALAVAAMISFTTITYVRWMKERIQK